MQLNNYKGEQKLESISCRLVCCVMNTHAKHSAATGSHTSGQSSMAVTFNKERVIVTNKLNADVK